MKSLRQILLAKVETVYGTDSVPVGATNAMLVQNLKINPIVTASAERKVALPYFGGGGKVITERHAEVSFDVELSASGTLGVAPGWGVLLKGSGMSETVSAGVSVIYAPVSASEQSLTFYAGVDGVNYKIVGSRGSFTAKLNAKGVPILSFKFTGLYAPPTDTALPFVTLTAFTAPLAVNAQNTTASLHGYAALLSDFSFDMGNKVVYRSLINGENVVFTDRAASGSITMEQPTMAAKDFFAAVTAGTKGALTLTHGVVAGSKVKIDAPMVQATDVQLSDQDGIQMIQMPLLMLPNTGNDELVITCL
jgi:hypothetical protein